MLDRDYMLKWGEPVRLMQVKTKGDVPGRGSPLSLDLLLVSDNISSFLDRVGIGENALKTVELEDEAAAEIFPLPLSFISCAWEGGLISCAQHQRHATDQYAADDILAKYPAGVNWSRSRYQQRRTFRHTLLNVLHVRGIRVFTTINCSL